MYQELTWIKMNKTQFLTVGKKAKYEEFKLNNIT